MSYKAGTVTTVTNNATITGTNTQWANTLYNVVKGQIIVVTQGTNTDIYTIEEIKSNTSLVLSRPAVRSTTNATYEILTTLNNSVSDDTIKLGNEIVAMSDFMRIMQAWTTGTQDTIKVTWGTQELTIATVAGLQKQIDNKYSREYQSIPPNTNLDTFYETGFWSQSLSANALFELGYPINSAGWLDVYPTTASMCRQEYTVYNNVKDKFYRTLNTANKTVTPWVRNTSEGMNYSRLYKYSALPLRALYGAAIGPNPNGREYMLLGPADASSDSIQEQTIVCGTIIAMRGSKAAANRTTAYDVLYNNSYNAFNLKVSSRNGTTNGFVSTVVTAMYKGIKCAFIQLQTAGGQPSSGAIFDGVVNTYDPRISFDDIFSIVYEKDLSQISEHSVPRMMVDAGYVAEQLEGKFDKTGDVITASGQALAIRNIDNAQSSYIGFLDASGYRRGMVGYGNDTDDFVVSNTRSGITFKLTADAKALIGSAEIMKVGDYGFGSLQAVRVTNSQLTSSLQSQLFRMGGGPDDNEFAHHGAGLLISYTPPIRSGLFISDANGDLTVFRSRADIANGQVRKNLVYTDGNTTKDSNGNLKAASPVVKLFSDDIELNDESEGVEMEHLGIGHYLIKGVVGFNADGAWGINNGFVIPQDHNGKNMVLIDYEVRPDGDIEIFVFHQQNADMPERFQNKRIKHFDEEGVPVYFENYEPCDVPESRWIDMRVEMPVNSLYNKRMKAIERAQFYAELMEYQNGILKNDIKQLN